MTTLEFSLRLPDLMHRELIERCIECGILPKQFAAECIEATLAGIRLPKVDVGRNGAFTSGYGFTRDEDVQEDDDVEIVEHRILL